MEKAKNETITISHSSLETPNILRSRAQSVLESHPNIMASQPPTLQVIGMETLN